MAQTQYAFPADLFVYGAPQGAFTGISTPTLQQGLDGASAEADSYLRSVHKLPLLRAGLDVVRAVCQIAAYEILVVRGFNPAAGADGNLEGRAKTAREWFRDVAAGRATADVDSGTSDTSDYIEPRVITSAQRGW